MVDEVCTLIIVLLLSESTERCSAPFRALANAKQTVEDRRSRREFYRAGARRGRVGQARVSRPRMRLLPRI